jgi:hypothetical protein
MVTAWMACYHKPHYYPINLSLGHFYFPSTAPISYTRVEGIVLFIDVGKELSPRHKGEGKKHPRNFQYILVRACVSSPSKPDGAHMIYMFLGVICCEDHPVYTAYLHIVFCYENLTRVGKVHQ